MHFILGEKIFTPAWEVIEALELYKIPIVSLTGDGAKPNRKFFRMTQVSRTKTPYKTNNPYRENEALYFFCDAPHLLKTARNYLRYPPTHQGCGYVTNSHGIIYG